MPTSLKPSIRILYVTGPGDVFNTYTHWKAKQDDPSQVSITYSSQFYDVCTALDAQGYLLSSAGEKRTFQDGRFTFWYCPPLFKKLSSSVFYYLDQLWSGLVIVWLAIRVRANVAVVASGTTQWFLLALLPLFGVKVIATLHNVLWSNFKPRSRAQTLCLNWSRHFFSKSCTAILAVSKDVSEQVVHLTAGTNKSIVRFIPAYRSTEFLGVTKPNLNQSPFRVLFIGRIEADKGVFDLLEVAKHFSSEGNQAIQFDLCGSGTALNALQTVTRQAGLEHIFLCHGHCDKWKMREILAQSHVVIAPTRTEFLEGFNKAVIEGVLAGRPVITSAVCPALFCVTDAAIEVPPNNPDAYIRALTKLLIAVFTCMRYE